MRVVSPILSAALLLVAASPFALAETPAKPASAVPPMLARPAQSAQSATPQPPTEIEKQIDQVGDALTLVRLSKQFEAQKDWRHQAYALKRLYTMRPMQGTVGFELAAAYARLDDKRNAYDTLVRLQSAGYGFAPENDARFENIRGTKVWDYIVANLQANLVPFGGGRVGFTLPGGDTLIESIAYDPARKQFLVASVRDGGISRVDEQGKVSSYIVADASNGLLASYGLAVDASRDRLWVIGNGVPHKKGIAEADFGRAVLYQFQLSSGKLQAKFETPVAHRPSILSSIAVSPNGDVMVADGIARRIYQLANGELKLIVENPKLTSIRGMIFNASGTKLYFADYDLGIFGLDLNTGKPFALAPDKGLTLYSVEGLAMWNGQLIAIQNGFPPARVMRLKLDATGTSVEHSQALDVAKPEFAMPTQGVVVGNGFWFVANSQRGQYDAYGLPRNAAALKPVTIYRSDLEFAKDSGKGGGRVTPIGGTQ